MSSFAGMNGRTVGAGKTNGSMRQFNEVANIVPKNTAAQMKVSPGYNANPSSNTQAKYQVGGANATGAKMESQRAMQTGGQAQTPMLNMTSNERAMKMQANSTAGHMGKQAGSSRSSFMTSLSMASWAEGWLQEVETSNFMPVTFRYAYMDGQVQKYIRCCIMFAKRQSMVHTLESRASYELQSGGTNMGAIANGRIIHFPNREQDTKKNHIYEETRIAAEKTPGYVKGSFKWINSSVLVPQTVAVSNAEVASEEGAHKFGVKILGFDNRCLTRNVADTSSFNPSNPEGSQFSLIVNKKGTSRDEIIFSYYPSDAISHIETMYGPVDDPSNFVSRNSIKMGNPVFVFMLCEFKNLWVQYLEKHANDLSDHEKLLEGALQVFFRQYHTVSFNDFQSSYDEEYLSKLLGLIVDTSSKVNVENRPDWNISHAVDEGDDRLQIPAGFATIIIDSYNKSRKIVNFNRDNFDISVSALGSKADQPGIVSFDLEVECFRPTAFVYKEYCQ